MMTRQAYFEMKADGLDVSDLANIYENTAEAGLLEKIIIGSTPVSSNPIIEDYLQTMADAELRKDIEAAKQTLLRAIKNGQAGISKNPPHHIVLLAAEPDATPIPYSSIFGNGEPKLKEIKEIAKPALRPASYKPHYIKRSSLYKGSNYTAPKKKLKR